MISKILVALGVTSLLAFSGCEHDKEPTGFSPNDGADPSCYATCNTVAEKLGSCGVVDNPSEVESACIAECERDSRFDPDQRLRCVESIYNCDPYRFRQCGFSI